MHIDQQMEQFSRAYVKAVAACAGFAWSTPSVDENETDIRDADAVRAIRPLDAALYLRAGGWTNVDGVRPSASLWTLRVNGDEYEALLPMSQEIGDYALRIGDLLKVLSVAEHRPQTEIYADLLTTTFDVTRIRIAGPELSTGTVPIEENAQIAQKARDMFMAAACAATDPRPVWHTRKPNQAVDYVRRVRIGQSGRGSYLRELRGQCLFEWRPAASHPGG